MQLHEIKAELKQRVARGLNFGIEAAEEVIASNSSGFNDFVLLKSKYNDLMHISSINTLPYDQIEIGLNRLRSSLLTIIDNLEESDLRQQQVNTDLKVQALPTRRTNFFKLLDIHFQNLEAIVYTQTVGLSEDTRFSGREAVYRIYDLWAYDIKRKQEAASVGDDERATALNYFKKQFRADTGVLEVYFKNIRHMVAYVLDSEVEQGFFLNTLKSLLSRYELALLFYYALCDMDSDLKTLVIRSGLVDDSVRTVLIRESHFSFLQ